MDDRLAILFGAVAGAIVGGAAGYLLLTDDGRRLRADLEPRLRDLARELRQARDTARDATGAAEAWTAARG